MMDESATPAPNSATGSPVEAASHVREFAAPLNEARTWIRALAILNILQGALLVLSCFGIVIAWLPIWMGVCLYQAVAALETAVRESDKDAFLRSQKKVATFFTINGVMIAIGVAIMLLSLAWIFFMGGLGMMEEMSHR